MAKHSIEHPSMNAFPNWLSSRLVLTHLGSLIVGVAIGTGSFQQNETTPRSPEEFQPASSTENRAVRTTELPSSFLNNSQSFGQGLTMAQRADAASYPIATLPSNLPRVFKLGHLLTEWGREDPDDALAWLQRSNLIEVETILSALILSGLAEVNPDEALNRALAMNQGSNPDQVNPGVLLHLCLQKSPHRFAEVFDLPSKTGSTDKGRVEFSPETEFNAIGQYLLRKYREAGDREWKPATFPSNFVEEWAKREPQAAYDFVLAQNELKNSSVTGDAFEDFAVGYSQAAAPGDVAEMIHYFLSTDEVPVSPQSITNSLLEGSSSQFDILRRATSNLPADQRNKLALGALKNASQPDQAEHRRRSLSLLATPEARMAIVQEYIREYPDGSQEMSTHLMALGHSQAEIHRALHPPPAFEP